MRLRSQFHVGNCNPPLEGTPRLLYIAACTSQVLSNALRWKTECCPKLVLFTDVLPIHRCPLYLLLFSFSFDLLFAPLPFPFFFRFASCVLESLSCNSTLNLSAGSIRNKWELQKCYEHVPIWSGGALALCFKWYGYWIRTSWYISVSFFASSAYNIFTVI